MHSGRCRQREEILHSMAQKRKLKQAEEAAAKLAKQQEEMSSLEKEDLREAEAEVSFVPAESLVRDCSVARIPT